MQKVLFSTAFILVLFAVISCSPKRISEVLVNTAWQADSLSTTAGGTLSTMQYQHYAVQGNKPTLIFGDSGQITGFTGCNLFFGNYLTEGVMISFDITGATAAVCPDTADVEQDYYDVLVRSRLYSVRGDSVLILMDKESFWIASFKKINIPKQ